MAVRSLLRSAAPWVLALLWAVAGLPLPAQAGGATGQLQVSAMVRRIAQLQVISQPAEVRITAADLARGYVEVSAPVQVSIRSNTGESFFVAFENRAAFARLARVRGLDSEVQLGAGGGLAPQQPLGSGMATVHRDLTFRFELADGAQAGTYPWPVQVWAQAL